MKAFDWTDEQLQVIRDCYKTGKPLRVAVARLGRNKTTVQLMAKKIGLTHPSAMTWSERDDARLYELWRDGYSADEIGRRIGGKSRNAVLGRVHRLRGEGVEFRARSNSPTGRPGKPRPARKRPAGPRRANEGRAAPLRRPLRVLEALPPPAVILKPGEVEPNGQPASLVELCAAACKWAVTGGPPHLFCNKVRRAGSAYCDEHTVRSFQSAAVLSTVDSAHIPSISSGDSPCSDKSAACG